MAVLPDPELFDLLSRQGTSLHLSRYGCPTGDASDILDNALHSKDPSRHLGIYNDSGYSNPEVERAIEESAGIDSVTQRRKALERIMALLVEDLVWVPLYVDQDVYALDSAYSWQPRSDSFILAAEIAARR